MKAIARERYRVDLCELQACCEANYQRLQRLLPDMRGVSPRPRRVALSHGEQLVAVLVIEVLENCPYTTSLRVRQEQHPAWLPAPQLEVRAYHDARMAEVVGAARSRSFLGRYPYPNAAMHQPDEKTQLNLFLGEWLGHCQALGHELEPVL